MFLLFQNTPVVLHGISSTLLEPRIHVFNASGTKSKICRHERNYILEKELTCSMWLSSLTCVSSQEWWSVNQAFCYSRNHDWLQEMHWQIQHAWKYSRAITPHDVEQLTNINICVFLQCDDLRPLLLQLDSQGPHDGFHGCYKHGIPVEMPHNVLD